MNKIFIPDFDGKKLTQKATMAEPIIPPLNAVSGLVVEYNTLMEVYEQHLKSLKSFPAPWLPESGKAEYVEWCDNNATQESQ